MTECTALRLIFFSPFQISQKAIRPVHILLQLSEIPNKTIANTLRVHTGTTYAIEHCTNIIIVSQYHIIIIIVVLKWRPSRKPNNGAQKYPLKLMVLLFHRTSWRHSTVIIWIILLLFSPENLYCAVTRN